MIARFSSKCSSCHRLIKPGERIRHGWGWNTHEACDRPGSPRRRMDEKTKRKLEACERAGFR